MWVARMTAIGNAMRANRTSFLVVPVALTLVDLARQRRTGELSWDEKRDLIF